MSDELMELPESWVWSTVQEVCELVQDGNYGESYPKKHEWVDVGIPFLTAAALGRQGEILLSELKFITAEKHSQLTKAQVKPGDIIFPNRGARDAQTVGSEPLAFLIPIEFSEANINPQLTLLRVSRQLVNSRFLMFALNSPIFLSQFRRATTGSALRFINLTTTKQMTIPLPPLNEQKRIVAAIESLRERSQKARSALTAIPELCDKFRQSVLAAAFRGDLTADWREQNPDVEPASVLLERIRLERQYRWMKETSKPTKYKEPALLDSESLPELPCNWTWANLDQLLFSLRNGLPKPPAEEKPGIPILRISAVRSREINLNDIRFYRLDKSESVDTYFLSKGDLLFTRYNGSRAFVGVCGMVQQLDGDLLYPDKLIRGQLVNQALCLPEYIELACNVGTSRKFIDSHIKTSAGQHGIAGGDIKLTPVPLPPVAEQQLIVDRIKQQFSSLQQLILQMKSCESNFQILDRAILAKAFRGELVEQDPNDEPASVLLDRIRAEREQQAQGKAKKPGKKGQRTIKAE